MNCAKHHPDWNNLTLYTSAEPCPMCASAIAWARIPEIVYATSIKTLTELGVLQIQIDSASVAKAAKDFPLGHGKIVSGVLEEEADILYARWADGFSDTASE